MKKPVAVSIPDRHDSPRTTGIAKRASTGSNHWQQLLRSFIELPPEGNGLATKTG
jgi:hypothetical protein